MYFKTACVFDVSQTEGKELPEADLPVIQADAQRLLTLLEMVADRRNIRVAFQPMEQGAFGVSKGGRIEVATGYTTGQQSKTLIHELVHEALHQRTPTDGDRGVGRSTAELEAEAVAFVVCQHFSLDVELRASRYIALWDGDAKKLAGSFSRVSEAARQLIQDVEEVSRNLEAPVPVVPAMS